MPVPDGNIFYVKQLINEEGCGWDMSKLRSCFLEKEVKEILKIGVGRHFADQIIWSFHSEDQFTVKSCYHVLKLKRDNNIDRPLSSRHLELDIQSWQTVWGLKLHPMEIIEQRHCY